MYAIRSYYEVSAAPNSGVSSARADGPTDAGRTISPSARLVAGIS